MRFRVAVRALCEEAPSGCEAEVDVELTLSDYDLTDERILAIKPIGANADGWLFECSSPLAAAWCPKHNPER